MIRSMPRWMSVVAFLPLLVWWGPTTMPIPVEPSTANATLLDDGSRIVTLWALDELSSSLDPESGGTGSVLRGGQVDYDRAALAYDVFAPNMLSFGFRERERAVLVDVGDFRVPPLVLPRDVVQRSPLTVFHTLTVERGKVQYTAPIDRTLNLLEGQPVLTRLPPEGIQHVEPQVGHVYLLRSITTTGESLAKFVVLDVRPGVSVTLRYAAL